MSLVGPRPTSFKANTYELWQTERLELPPRDHRSLAGLGPRHHGLRGAVPPGDPLLPRGDAVARAAAPRRDGADGAAPDGGRMTHRPSAFVAIWAAAASLAAAAADVAPLLAAGPVLAGAGMTVLVDRRGRASNGDARRAVAPERRAEAPRSLPATRGRGARLRSPRAGRRPSPGDRARQRGPTHGRRRRHHPRARLRRPRRH